MAYVSCSSCHGTGRVYFGEYSTCTSCMGTGTMFVADKTPSYSNKNKTVRSAGSSSGKSHSFEDTVTGFLTLGTFVFVSFIWKETRNMELYVAIGIGILFSIIVFKIFNGPLRFLVTWFGYLLGLAILVLIIYGVVSLVNAAA